MEEEVKRCKRCNRKLKDEESKQRGFGETCYKKYLDSLSHINRLFYLQGGENERKSISSNKNANQTSSEI